MAEAKSTKVDLPSNTARLAAAATKRAQSSQAAAARGSFAGKKWSQLLPADKDAAVKALLLEAGMIEPD